MGLSITSGRMTTQEQLHGEVAGVDKATIFYRSVKSKQRLVEPDQQVIDTPSELSDIEELLESIKEDKLDYPLPLTDSGMEGLRSDRLFRIFESGGKETFVSDLLGIFCESLKGKQRSADKYAMLIFSGGSFLLAHVRAEKGMSIEEEKGQIHLINRFLDIDNILSAALFEQEPDGAIMFSHFTDSGSDSFRDFLGVNEHHLNYRRKTIQVLCYYMGRRGYDCKFEFTKDEFSDKWLRDENLRLTGNKLRFKDDGEESRSHEIKEIRWGKDTYNSVEGFKSDFKEQSLGLNIDKDKYDNLTSYPSESETRLSVFNAKDSIDHRRKVSVVKDSGERESIRKSNTADNLHVIYASSHIRMESSFAEDIFHGLIGGNDVRIYHASSSPAPQALNIGGVTFLNINSSDVSRERKQFLEEIYCHAHNRGGETLRKCLMNALLHVLKPVANQQLEHTLEQIMNIYAGNPANGATVSTKENEGPNIIEYKNRQHLENGDSAGKIVDEIKKEKQKGNDTKVLLWGFTEQSRRVDGLNTQSWGDDRITNIEGRVQDKLSEEDVDYEEYLMQPVNLDATGDRITVVGVVF